MLVYFYHDLSLTLELNSMGNLGMILQVIAMKEYIASYGYADSHSLVTESNSIDVYLSRSIPDHFP